MSEQPPGDPSAASPDSPPPSEPENSKPKPKTPPGCIWGALVFLILFGVCLANVGDGSTQSSDADRETFEVFDLEWPLTVDSGTLYCSGGEVTFEANGTRYAVNGTAKATGKYPSIDPIWAPAPGGLGLKRNIGDLIDQGLRLCNR